MGSCKGSLKGFYEGLGVSVLGFYVGLGVSVLGFYVDLGVSVLVVKGHSQAMG